MTEERHPIASKLLATSYGTVLEQRACYAVCRFLAREKRVPGPYSRSHPHYSVRQDAMEYLQSQVKALNYEQFLAELAKPDGGLIAQVPGVGKGSIAVLRQRCIKTTTEYGYA